MSKPRANLTVQVKICQDPQVAGRQWAKIWVRGGQDFVFDRQWIAPLGQVVALAVHIDAAEGQLRIDLSGQSPSTLEISGQTFQLVPFGQQ